MTFKKKLLAAAFALFTLPPAAFAQAAPAAATPAAEAARPDADPALWVVRDEDTTIYMFGTFHLLDGQRDWFNDEVRTAFDASDELVLEAKLPENPAELQPLIMRYAVDQSGRTLSQRLTPEQNAALAGILEPTGAPMAAFDRLEPWFMTLTLANLAGQRLGITGEHGPETVLSRAARERNIPVSELEGMEFQLRMFDGMPEEQQLAQLRQTLDNVEELDNQLAPMLAAWSEGDVEALVAIQNAVTEQDPELYRLIFSDRNATWAQWVQQRLERPGTVFVAVGAGHLAGRDNVFDYLSQQGITASRVTP